MVITMGIRVGAGSWLSLLASATVAAAMLAGPPPVPAAATAPAQRAHTVPAGMGGKVWDVIPTHAKVVALTIDTGGDDKGCLSMLQTLRQRHVRASFFLLGNFVSAHEADARAMAAAGRVGDHSMTHPHFTRLTDARIRQEVLGAEQTIVSVTGADPWPWFRFPFGDHNVHTVSVVNSVGFVPVGWTVDTLGWQGTSRGITVAKIVARVLTKLRPGEIVLMHCASNRKDHSTLDAHALPLVITQLQHRGYQFVTLDALLGLGYQVLTSDGGVSSFGAPGYGSARTLRAGVTARAVAADHGTGGYWILTSDGAVVNRNAPRYGSLAGKIPAGQSVKAIAASPSKGYWVLTSNGGVHNFGAPWYGSAAGKLPAGVTAIGLAADPATGGYWILASDGSVTGYNAPSYGSLAGKIPAGQAVTAIAASPSKGYWVLTSNGGVHNFGAPLYGSAAGKLPAGVTAIGLAADPATGGYWILASDGSVTGYNAPSYGSLAGKIPAGQAVTAIDGQ